MAKNSESTTIRVEIEKAPEIEELIIGFRKEGELHELMSVAPPAAATLETLDHEER